MSDDENKSTDANGSGPVAGELLAKARQARDISLNDIAKELHLDEPKVLALEQNRFDALGAPVFAKGYLRKYAELVGVSGDDVLADYYRLNRSAAAPPLVTRRGRPMRDFSPGPWLLVLALFLIVGLALLWWFTAGADRFAGGDDARTATPAADGVQPAARQSPAAAEPAVALPGGAAPVAERPATTAGDVAAPGAQPVETAVEPARSEAPSRPPAPAADGHLQLRLAFRGDCWTEVTDASGSRLYFGLGAAGREVTVAGEPPLNVLLGDSENVAVFVNGASFAIPASARRGETARLSLTAR